MAILVECPKCRYRNPEKELTCRCGNQLTKHSGRIFWDGTHHHNMEFKIEEILNKGKRKT